MNKNNGFVTPYNSKQAQNSKIGSSKVFKFPAYFHWSEYSLGWKVSTVLKKGFEISKKKKKKKKKTKKKKKVFNFKKKKKKKKKKTKKSKIHRRVQLKLKFQKVRLFPDSRFPRNFPTQTFRASISWQLQMAANECQQDFYFNY